MGHVFRSRYSPLVYFKLVFVWFLFIKSSGVESPSLSFLASYLGQTVNG